jgi:thioredoxin 1
MRKEHIPLFQHERFSLFAHKHQVLKGDSLFMSKLISVTEKSFSSIIAKGTVLVDFSAEWCGPCKMLSPILEELAEELKDSVNIVKIDIDQEQNLASTFEITSVPTLILFKDGKEIYRTQGVKDRKTLKNLLQQE